jgi:NhaA family Na+:H+ antiporter
MTSGGSPSSDRSAHPIGSALPAAPVERVLRPFVRFLEVEAASGVVLLIATGIALALANSPWSEMFAAVWKTRVRLAIGDLALDKPLLLWINDGMMTLFFFVVGLEIKRELIVGELRDWKKAALPVLAALGGMAAPAALYLMLQGGRPGREGWGIPMATDIAFVVGILALLGPRVPIGLRIILLSLAIADDIGAVLVIAVFYSTDIAILPLLLAGLGLGLAYGFNRLGVRRVPIYVILGAGVWLACLKSGVHPTVAGVALGLLTPASAWIGDRALLDIVSSGLQRLRGEGTSMVGHDRPAVLRQLQWVAREGVSPLERLEVGLHPWIAFVIMPLFALANAGVAVQLGALRHPVALAVVVGLVVGKPLGIVLVSWLGVRAGLARLPAGMNWKIMIGAGCLAGIGFTMSLFIAGLALKDELLHAGKIGTLAGSTFSALLGSFLLLMFLPRGK